MHYTTIDPKGKKLKYAMVIDDVTAHINPKHLYHDETMCHSARIDVKTL
jgi:hypothetical protein